MVDVMALLILVLVVETPVADFEKTGYTPLAVPKETATIFATTVLTLPEFFLWAIRNL